MRPKAKAFDSKYFEPPGAVRRLVRTDRGILLDLDDERFRVDVLAADLLRFKLSAAGIFDERPTFACVPAAPPAAPVFEISETRDSLTLATERLRFVAEKRDLTFDVFRTDGSAVLEAARDENGRGRGLLCLNDSFLVERRAAPGDCIYGLGQKVGPIDRRGGSFVLWNTDVLSPDTRERNRLDETDLAESGRGVRFDPYYTSIPFFYHARERAGSLVSAGFFIDNGYKASFDFSAADRLSFSFSGGQYTEYVFAGPDMKEILRAYTQLTGRMPVPPLWAIGHHQCRWYDYTDREFLEIASQYRRRGIPCDVLWLDIGHMDGYRVFTWDERRFPDPDGTMRALAEQRFRCVTIVDPGIKSEPGYPVFDEAKEKDLLCKTDDGRIYIGQVWPGRTAFPDFVKSEARAFWAAWNARHVARGIAGIWNDMNEPATGEIAPFSMRFDREGANFPHERYHNQYALLMAMATRDGLLAAEPNRRPFVLSRAGSPGIQRVAAQWMGDNQSDWDHLALANPMALGMGISGQPFVGADIAGFAGAATAELAARWFQYGALTPFCRCHNAMGEPDQYPWSFGEEVERIARQALELRYELLPYLYSAFVRASETGEPVQRPLFFDYPDDPRARSADDQFLLGESLLVAPVVHSGRIERDLYLPNGSWIDWRTGEARRGGARHTVPAPLSVIPIFAKGGSIVPVLEAAPPSTMHHHPELLELRVFVPGEDGAFTSSLVEDDGLTFAFEAGARLRTEMVLTRSGGEVRVSASVRGNHYPEFRRRKLRCIFYNAGKPRSVALNGAPSTDAAGAGVDGQPAELCFDNAGEPFEVLLTL